MHPHDYIIRKSSPNGLRLYGGSPLLWSLIWSLILTRQTSASNLLSVFGNKDFENIYNNNNDVVEFNRDEDAGSKGDYANHFSNRIPMFNGPHDNEDKSFTQFHPSGGVPSGPIGSNALPQSSPYGQDYVAPKYMIELYEKFESDRYSHPMANIVRSFVNIYDDPLERTASESINSIPGDSKTPTRRHIMKFNVSSVTRDDEIHLAELRLYTLVEADRNSYYGTPAGNNREVELYEHVDLEDNMPGNEILLDRKEIYGSKSGWETFIITDAVKSWARSEVQVKTVEVRISTIHARYVPANVDIETKPHRENEPLLVVFSNDKKKIKSEKKELHEIIMHYESEFGNFQDDMEWEYYDDYEDEGPEDHHVNKRDTSGIDENDLPSITKRVRRPYNSTELLLAYKRQKLRDMYEQLMAMETEIEEEEENAKTGNAETGSDNEERNRKRRSAGGGGRRRRKTNCHRKRLRVNFQDIKWHNWIIAPKGYDAWECTGRCTFPMSEHLTPTKHAIIQTLLHTHFPKKTTRACCVPTQLDPISVLYVDEKNVVTYKYKYEGMVVASCGCR